MPKKSCRAGFTMIEVLVSVVMITAVFSTMAYMAFTYAASSVLPNAAYYASHEQATAFMLAVDRDFSEATYARVYSNVSWVNASAPTTSAWSSNAAAFALHEDILAANPSDMDGQYDQALIANGLLENPTSNWWELHILGKGGQIISIITIQRVPGDSEVTMVYNRYTAQGGLTNNYLLTSNNVNLFTTPPVVSYSAGNTFAANGYTANFAGNMFTLILPNAKLEHNTEPAGSGYNEQLVLNRVVR